MAQFFSNAVCRLSERAGYASISDHPGVETALMIPKTYHFREAYGRLKMPVAIVAGMEDRLIEAQQSAELHRDIAHSTFRCVPNTGHMVHQTATAEVMSAIDMVATEKKEPVSEMAKSRKDIRASVT
jgi:pimeloyl-ACP methyl ester carboxylesterase